MKVGVVGLGTMGAGIAQLCVEAGLPTVGREVTPQLGQKARGQIEHFLTRKVEKGQLEESARDEALLQLVTTTELADLAACDVVIEAIVEELGPKQALFAELDRICRPDAVLATNTSALSVTEIAAASAHPERVVGMHFFNPAPLMPLVEIVRAERTEDAP
ncbi:MAG TPA: 3-hydroxyacyl-CoA dehydrogenase NAD-binding domain-containing protein, partial [Gaiellaceae bacterium]|nr:3-hydroxyacyl-CoA dehydrogenase NAD-binding domain-containing protein [Gaiellaceae bacterium]